MSDDPRPRAAGREPNQYQRGTRGPLLDQGARRERGGAVQGGGHGRRLRGQDSPVLRRERRRQAVRAGALTENAMPYHSVKDLPQGADGSVQRASEGSVPQGIQQRVRRVRRRRKPRLRGRAFRREEGGQQARAGLTRRVHASMLAPFDVRQGRTAAESSSKRRADSTLKYKLDPELDAFTVARQLMVGLSYPYDFGFVPGTRAEDGDPLDVDGRAWHASYPGVVLPCRAAGRDRRAEGKGPDGCQSPADRASRLGRACAARRGRAAASRGRAAASSSSSSSTPRSSRARSCASSAGGGHVRRLKLVEQARAG